MEEKNQDIQEKKANLIPGGKLTVNYSSVSMSPGAPL